MLSRFLLLTTLLVLAATAYAQLPASTTPPPTGLPIKQTFLTNDDGWAPIGEGATVTVVPNPLTINSADGALQLNYTIAQGQVSAFLLPIGTGALAKARSFRFQIRSDYAAKLIFGIQEQDGGRYTAGFSVPKDKWQTVELSPSDFNLSTGEGDPKDPDNKLDLDQVQFLGIIDAGVFFSQANNPAFNELIGVSPGAHHLYLADFEISAAPLTGAAGLPAPPDAVDLFAHPQIGWYMVGGMEAKVIGGAPLPGKGLSLQYTQAPQKVAGLIRFLTPGKFLGASKLSLALASEKAATLVVQVEDGVGDKFNTTVYVPSGATKAENISVSFADFKPADDTRDKNAKLDLTKVDRFLVFDATGIMGSLTAAAPNTLYLGDIRAIH